MVLYTKENLPELSDKDIIRNIKQHEERLNRLRPDLEIR